MPVTIRFQGTNLEPMIDLATRRREHAILMTSGPPNTPEDAERDNPIENHIAGVTAEYAVADWLTRSGVTFRCNFEDVKADFAGAPDIEAKTTRCDVKSSYEHRYPERQRDSLVVRKDIVIWCWSREEGVFSKTGVRISTHVIDVYGWSLASTIKPLPAKDGWIMVPDKDVSRDLPALLARL